MLERDLGGEWFILTDISSDGIFDGLCRGFDSCLRSRYPRDVALDFDTKPFGLLIIPQRYQLGSGHAAELKTPSWHGSGLSSAAHTKSGPGGCRAWSPPKRPSEHFHCCL
jgi:hypothetical protein